MMEVIALVIGGFAIGFAITGLLLIGYAFATWGLLEDEEEIK